MRLLLNFKDCFFSESDLSLNENKKFFSRNTEYKEIPIVNKNAVENFKKITELTKQEITFSDLNNENQLSADWWLELFEYYGIYNIKVNEVPVLISSPLFQSKIKEINELISLNKVDVVLDSDAVRYIELREKEKKSFDDYMGKYSHILGVKRRKSLIPVNEYEVFEYKEISLSEKIHNIVFEFQKNQTITKDVAERILSMK